VERHIHRRQFLVLSFRAAAAAHFIPLERLQATSHSSARAARLSVEQRRNLRSAINEIIPAEGRMPSVSAVGGVRYIESLSAAYPAIGSEITAGLESLERRSRKAYGRSFALNAAEQRLQVLRAMEKEDTPPGFFATFRNLVYEAYYTDPRVWKLIGYEFRSSRRRRAPLEPFDERLLARVRKMGRLYREAF
jgi:Gluconate 2-dehydrogenase subunit 3